MVNTFYSGFAIELIKLAQGTDPFASLDKELARKGIGSPKTPTMKPPQTPSVQPVKPPKSLSQAQAEQKEFSVQTQRGPAAQKQMQQGMAEQRKRDQAYKQQQADEEARRERIREAWRKQQELR